VQQTARDPSALLDSLVGNRISPIPLGRDGEWEDYKTKMSWTMHPEKTRLRPTGITISFI
jgi:hypothetical protein